MAAEVSVPNFNRIKRALVRSEIRHLAGHSEVMLRPDAIDETTERVWAAMRLTAAGNLADAGGKTLLYYLTSTVRQAAGHLYLQVERSPTRAVDGELNATVFGSRPHPKLQELQGENK